MPYRVARWYISRHGKCSFSPSSHQKGNGLMSIEGTIQPCPYNPEHERSIQCSECHKMVRQSELFIFTEQPFYYVCKEHIDPRGVRMLTDDSKLSGRYGIAGPLEIIDGYRHYCVTIPGLWSHGVRFMEHQVDFLFPENRG